jgi:hypothetical protein
MFTFAQLRELEGRLRNRKVLSVFVDMAVTTADTTWRDGLNRALARLDATPPHLNAGERTALDLCMAHLRTALEGMRATPGERGWVAYVTTDDVVAAGPVRTRLETAAFWQNGIVVRPLMPVLVKPRVAVPTMRRAEPAEAVVR